MTISERINLHRCGYSRAEIEELAKQEREEREHTEQKTEPEKAEQTEQKPEPERVEKDSANDPVLDAINKLTEAIQGRNINSKAQPDTKEETMDDLIKYV